MSEAVPERRHTPVRFLGIAEDILEVADTHDLDPLTVALYQSRKPKPDPTRHRCPKDRVPLLECTCGLLTDLEGLNDAN